MQAQPQPSWWLSALLIPAFFTVLGAILGFLVGEVKDKLQTRRSKRAFLEAIAVEVAALTASLEQAAAHASDFVVMAQATGHAPQLVPRWGTIVFDTQLGTLRDVSDKLVLQTIEAYAPVGRIEKIATMVNEHSRDFAMAKAGNERAEAQTRLISALRVLKEEIDLTVPKMRLLIKEIHKKVA